MYGMNDIEDIVFINAIKNIKSNIETCKEVEAYEISCALLGVDPDGVSSDRIQNVDSELNIL